MTDAELRSLVRDAIARRLTAPGQPLPSGTALLLHSSHARFDLPRGDEGDGPCLIEPTVHCTHCGFCQSYGH
jgi:hypothetical protein